MTREEKEILIADYFLVNRTKAFGRIYYSFPGESTELTKNDLNFTTSLDWINPVLDKMGDEECRIIIILKEGKWHCRITKDLLGTSYMKVDGKSRNQIGAIVEAVIQYIQWYNERRL